MIAMHVELIKRDVQLLEKLGNLLISQDAEGSVAIPLRSSPQQIVNCTWETLLDDPVKFLQLLREGGCGKGTKQTGWPGAESRLPQGNSGGAGRTQIERENSRKKGHATTATWRRSPMVPVLGVPHAETRP